MDTVYFSPVILGACGLIAYALTKLYCYFDDWYENRNNLLHNDIYRRKCRKVRDFGRQYYIDMMQQDPEKLAKHLADIRTKELIKSNSINDIYQHLRRFKYDV